MMAILAPFSASCVPASTFVTWMRVMSSDTPQSPGIATVCLANAWGAQSTQARKAAAKAMQMAPMRTEGAVAVMFRLLLFMMPP